MRLARTHDLIGISRKFGVHSPAKSAVFYAVASGDKAGALSAIRTANAVYGTRANNPPVAILKRAVRWPSNEFFRKQFASTLNKHFAKASEAFAELADNEHVKAALDHLQRRGLRLSSEELIAQQSGGEDAFVQTLTDLTIVPATYSGLPEAEQIRAAERALAKDRNLRYFATDAQHEFLCRHPRAVEAAKRHLPPEALFDVRLDYYKRLTAKGVPHKAAVLLADKLVGWAIENEETRGAYGEPAHLVMALYEVAAARSHP